MTRDDSCTALQARLCDFYGYDHAVLLGRARSGLIALSEVLGLAGRAAVIPSNICPVVAVALLSARTNLRLAPVDTRSGLADDDRLVACMADQPAAGLVMPTHLYGQLGMYDRTVTLARRDGWFVLENDTLCAARVRHGHRRAFGDALLTSFGDGKTASAGGGGALLTDDAALAADLQRVMAGWAPPDAETSAVELHMMMIRRHLRPLGRVGLAEGLLATEQAQLRHSFAPALAPAVIAALDDVEPTLARRASVAAMWDDALEPLSDVLRVSPLRVSAPWRLIRHVATPGRRDRLASMLRQEGLDVGINFPALSESFPSRLGDQSHPDANAWADGVLNLWLDEAVETSQIQRAAQSLTRQLREPSPQTVDQS